MKDYIKLISSLSVICALSACGGGGDSSSGGGGSGGGSGGTPPPTNYTVTASVTGEGGSVSPTSQQVQENTTASITLSAEEYYEIGDITSDCGGSLEGNTFTTDAVTANCAIEVSFAEQQLSPTITVADNDVTDATANIELPLEGTTSIAWTLATNSIDDTLTISATSTDGLDYTLDELSGVTLTVNDQAELDATESFTLTVTNALELSSTYTVNVTISREMNVSAFCFVGYCHGEQPKEFRARGIDIDVVAHYQAIMGSTATFNYAVNSDFGTVESIEVAVFNQDTNTYVGDATVIHDDYLKEVTVYTENLTHDRHVILEVTATNELNEAQSISYDVFYATSKANSGLILEPFTKVGVAELDKQYTYSGVRPLDDYGFTEVQSSIEVDNVRYNPTHYDSARNVELEWSFDGDTLTFKLTDPENLVDYSDDWISPFHLRIYYYIVDENGNRVNDQLQIAQAPFMLVLSEYDDYVANRKEAEDMVLEYIKLVSSELEIDMVLRFWVETFEANGYEELYAPAVINRNLEQHNKEMIALIGRLYRMVYTENTAGFNVGLTYGTVVNYDFWNEILSGFDNTIQDELFDVTNKTRQPDVNQAAEYKVGLINEYVAAYNEINNTSYLPLNSDLFNGRFPNQIGSAKTYSLLIGNTDYGTYSGDSWLFDGGYSYLNGVHSSSEKLFFELIR